LSNNLPAKTKIYYGLGQAVWGVTNIIFNFYLVFHYSQNLGLSGALAGTAALIALGFDAISDPLVAYWSDNLKSKYGRRHPLMAFSLIPFCASLYLILVPPAGLGEWGLFAWLTVFAILSRVTVTLFVVPHLSLAAELSEDYQERSRIFGYRIFFGYVGAMLLQGITLAVLLPDDKGGVQYAAGYSDVGLLAVIMIMVTGGLSIWGTKDRIPYLSQPPASKPDILQGAKDMMALWTMRNFRAFMAGSLQYQVIIGIAETLIFFLLAFYYGFDSKQSALLISLIFVALPPAYFVAQWGVRVWGKGQAALRFLVIGSIFGSLHVTLRLTGVLPPNGSEELFAIVGIILLFNQIAIIAYLIAQGSMIGDMADERAAATGVRQEGLFAAAQTFAQKLTFGVGTFFGGLIIDAAEFSKGMDPATITDTQIQTFGWLVGPMLFLPSITAAISYWFYDLSPEKLAIYQGATKNPPNTLDA